jgi:hypothetical protein
VPRPVRRGSASPCHAACLTIIPVLSRAAGVAGRPPSHRSGAGKLFADTGTMSLMTEAVLHGAGSGGCGGR